MLVVIAGGCGDDGPGPDVEPPTLVSVETQRCAQPNRFHGVGIVVGNDLVLTAGHTVEGDLRQVTVDGAPARVVTIDRRLDLALVSADSAEPDAHVEVARKVPSAATMLGPNATSTVEIDRAVTLVIEHATDRATYRRDVVIFSPGVSDGEIGVPCRSPAANDLTWPDPSNTC